MWIGINVCIGISLGIFFITSCGAHKASVRRRLFPWRQDLSSVVHSIKENVWGYWPNVTSWVHQKFFWFNPFRLSVGVIVSWTVLIRMTFSLLLFKNERRAYEIPVCLSSFYVRPSVRLSLCPPLMTFEPTCRFHEIQQRGHAAEGGLDAIICNHTTSTILKSRRLKLLSACKTCTSQPSIIKS
jgi:hypothetical protein